MKLKHTAYIGSPCWQANGRWFWLDADWNTRFPYGTSLGLRFGPRRGWPGSGGNHPLPRWGFTLDVHAPLGEPNRLYVFGPRRHYMIGLVSWHAFRQTGERATARGIPVVEGKTVRCCPRLVRGQAWDWRKSEGTMPPRWRWIVVHPNDYHARWAAAHPQEAAVVEERRMRRRNSGGR